MLPIVHCSEINVPTNPSAVMISAILIRSGPMPLYKWRWERICRAENNSSKWNEQRSAWLIFCGIFQSFRVSDSGANGNIYISMITVTFVACTFDVCAGARSVSCLLTQGRAALAHGISHHLSYPGLRVPGDLRCSLRMVAFHSCTYLSPDDPLFFLFLNNHHSSQSQNKSHSRNPQDHHLSQFHLLDHCFTLFTPCCAFPARKY